MSQIAAILYISLSIIVHYQLIGFCLLGIILVNFFRDDRKKMIVDSVALLLATIVVVGIPMGIIKEVYPQADVPEAQIIEEVRKWIG